MHALHNAQLLRETLPRSLTEPQPYLVDRKAKHYELAANLRVTGPLKRAETAAKAKATREKNKKLKASAQQAGPILSEGSSAMTRLDAGMDGTQGATV